MHKTTLTSSCLAPSSAWPGEQHTAGLYFLCFFAKWVHKVSLLSPLWGFDICISFLFIEENVITSHHIFWAEWCELLFSPGLIFIMDWRSLENIFYFRFRQQIYRWSFCWVHGHPGRPNFLLLLQWWKPQHILFKVIMPVNNVQSNENRHKNAFHG